MLPASSAAGPAPAPQIPPPWLLGVVHHAEVCVKVPTSNAMSQPWSVVELSLVMPQPMYSVFFACAPVSGASSSAARCFWSVELNFAAGAAWPFMTNGGCTGCPVTIFKAFSLCTAFWRVPSVLDQLTTYNVFVSISITGVLRMPQRRLIPHKSISVAAWPFAVWPLTIGLIGFPRFVLDGQSFAPVFTSNA